MKRILLVLLGLSGCDRDPASTNGGVATAAVAPAEVPLMQLGAFDYKEKMTLPPDVTAWDGKLVKATGFINPGRQVRDLTEFALVKDRASCCFGARPQPNHFVAVTLKPGQKTNYTPDPVSVVGVLKIGERWDGDWLLGVYWIDAGEVVK